MKVERVSNTIIKQKIKCLSCGNKTVQQSPIERYGNDFYCQKCDIMWKVSKETRGCFFG